MFCMGHIWTSRKIIISIYISFLQCLSYVNVNIHDTEEYDTSQPNVNVVLNDGTCFIIDKEQITKHLEVQSLPKTCTSTVDVIMHMILTSTTSLVMLLS